MRYVIFPSAHYPDGTRPSISSIFQETDIDIIHGPTKSGIYLIDVNTEEVEWLKLLVEPFYILFEDFEIVSIH